VKNDDIPDGDTEKGISEQRQFGRTVFPQLVVFTDLDGTLLDHDTYEWKAAEPALKRCRERGVPVVLISSKTRAEIEPLREELRLKDPFVSENGGGVFLPKAAFTQRPAGAFAAKMSGFSRHDGTRGDPDETSDLWEMPLGIPYERLVSALKDIREALGLPLKGFSEMGVMEVCQLTGLSPDDARLAQLRDYDEPFIVAGDTAVDRAVLSEAAAKKGLKVTRGGRFFHLQGHNDKGEAMIRILALYKKRYGAVRTIGLGDSQNDFSMLRQADYPVLVRSKPDKTSIAWEIPGLWVTENIGPAGWNSAVLRILQENEEVLN